jgi:hypothetical protein
MSFRFALMSAARNTATAAVSNPFRALALAGAAVGAAVLGFAGSSPSAPGAAPDPIVAAVAPPARGEGPEMRSFAYYPEQLAALSSLSSFSPVSDPGRPAAAPATAAPTTVAPAAQRKPVRSAESPRRAEPAPLASAALPAPGSASAVEPAQAREAGREGLSVFGVALPRPGWPDGESLRRQAAHWGDAAASLPGRALALGAGVTRLWPLGRDREPPAQPGAQPPLAN